MQPRDPRPRLRSGTASVHRSWYTRTAASALVALFGVRVALFLLKIRSLPLKTFAVVRAVLGVPTPAAVPVNSSQGRLVTAKF